jgi:glycosyltransferase involved in cell wall biosynthesis
MEHHFVYLSEIDVSIDNGRGINEREFVRSLVEAFPDEVTYILPRPEHPDRFSAPSIEYVRNHSASALPYGLHLTDLYRRLGTVHARRPVTALVTRLGVAPVVPLLARRRLGIPTILKTLMVYGFTHEVFSTGWLPKPHRVVSWTLGPVFRAVIEGCVLADTPAEALAEWTLRHYRIPKDRLAVIPNAANTDVFVPGDRFEARRTLGLERFDKIVGYTGILGAERNLDVVIRAIAGLRRRDVALLMVGAGPLRSALEKLAEDLGMRDRVIFVGQIDYHQVPAVMRALDVAIDLSLVRLRVGDGSVIPASFSQKLAQYLATGVPVLAWSLTDTRFIEEHDVGRAIPLEQPAAMGTALAELLDLPAEQKEAMGKRSRRIAEREFSIRNLVRKRMALWKASVRPACARG